MKVIICGSPHWGYNEIVKDVIVQLHRESRLKGKHLLIIHGGEPGVETVAQEYCEHLGIDTIIHPAVRVLGDKGYLRRNELMLNYHKPDLVVCFAYSFKESVVMTDMLNRADLKGIKTKAVDYESIVRRDVDGFSDGIPLKPALR